MSCVGQCRQSPHNEQEPFRETSLSNVRWSQFIVSDKNLECSGQMLGGICAGQVFRPMLESIRNMERQSVFVYMYRGDKGLDLDSNDLLRV